MTELLHQLDAVFEEPYYLTVNTDVAAAGVDPFRHFVTHGLLEGRAPSAGVSNARCFDASVEMLGSEVSLRRQLTRLRQISVVSKGAEQRLAGRTQGQVPPFWSRPDFGVHEIDLSYIRNCADWQAPQATVAQAVRQFAAEYKAALRPFSPVLVPDAGFYNELNGTDLSAIEIQEIWAQSDTANTVIVSMPHFMQHYCGDAALHFDGFDQLDYIARNAHVDVALNPLQAFAHFITCGLEQGARPPQKLSLGLVSIIDARLERLEATGGRGMPRAAFKMQQSGLRSDVIDRFAHQNAVEAGDLAVPDPETPRDGLQAFWTRLNMATARIEQGQHRQAIAAARQALRQENGSVFALDKVHESASLWHQNLHRSLRLAARSGRAMPPEQQSSARFTDVLDAVPRFHAGSAETAPGRAGQGIRRIGIIADMGLPQCKRYRVDQKLEYLQALEIDFALFDVHQAAEQAAAECALFDAWIFYRTPAYYAVLKLLNRARVLGLPTVFEIDDLLVDPEVFPETRESYGAGFDPDQYAELKVLPYLYAGVARNCDFAIASTPALSDVLGGLVRSGQSFVMPNGIDSGHLSALQSLGPRHERRADDVVRIFVSSATKSHKDYVAKVFLPQAIEIAEAFPGKVHFSLCGEFAELHGQLNAAARQSIGHIDLGWDYATYLATVQRFDINVVPLEKSTFTDCKSEIKWLEAGLLGIPSVLSATDAYTRCIEGGETGLLVRGDDYVTPISHLCGAPAERAQIGDAARRAVLAGFSVTQQCATLGSILERIGQGA
ncbi:hypothetical protein PVW51_06355 [Sulfitobacter sp. PR48]|uniref:glycosyltransferase family protein n=1 Tax=Sulfitobacter sp. PR48 TaxID=3028383 RepID=UPI00237AA321|nr:glycosyltransferase [Sulfitobacter sp. PR48]MDD9720306.1 hypothetical protein [Sulfitobacter sp. PR48]